jgi:hypothetical protein
LLGKPEETTPVGRSRGIWKDTVKMMIKREDVRL